MTTTTKIAGEAMTDEQIIEMASRFAHSDGWLNGDGAIAFARALLASKPAASQCVHVNNPKACYRVRCQLGNKCVDDDMSPRPAPTERSTGICFFCSEPIDGRHESDCPQADQSALPRASEQADEAVTDAFAGLVAFHAEQLDSNPYCYFELAYTRSTAWMAWITDRPAQGEPGTATYAKSRKVIVRGQGDTPTEACQDALNALNTTRAKDSK